MSKEKKRMELITTSINNLSMSSYDPREKTFLQIIHEMVQLIKDQQTKIMDCEDKIDDIERTIDNADLDSFEALATDLSERIDEIEKITNDIDLDDVQTLLDETVSLNFTEVEDALETLENIKGCF